MKNHIENKRGYSVLELLGLILVVSFVSIFAIVKVSHAFSDTDNKQVTNEIEKNTLAKAASSYVNANKTNFQKDEAVFIYAKDVAEAGFIIAGENYNSIKIKVLYLKDANDFLIEIV